MKLYMLVYCDHMTRELITSDKIYQSLQWFELTCSVFIKSESHDQDEITNEPTYSLIW